MTTRCTDLALVIGLAVGLVGLAGWGRTFDHDWPDDAGVHALGDACVPVRFRAPAAGVWQPATAALPCGTPSREDIPVTDRLTEAGKLIGISELDHIIHGDGTSDVRSIREH